MYSLQDVAELAHEHALKNFGLEKMAMTPGVLAGVLGGLGAGAEAYRSFWDAPTEETLQSRLGRAGVGFLRGGAVGAGLGYGAGKALGHFSPQTVKNFDAWRPFKNTGYLGDEKKPEGILGWAELAARHAVPLAAGGVPGLALSHLPSPDTLKRTANSGWEVWKHPAARAASGLAAGYGGARFAKSVIDDWRIKQYAAQRMEQDHPELLNPGEVGFAMGDKHMGAYQSSKD